MPDFFKDGPIDDFGVMRVDIDEIKTSRVAMPGLDKLTDNQAVFLDALLRGEIDTITPGPKLRAFLEDRGAVGTTIQVGRFDIINFQLFPWDCRGRSIGRAKYR